MTVFSQEKFTPFTAAWNDVDLYRDCEVRVIQGEREVIGIDQGALILMIENYRSELIWDVMSRNESLKLAMKEVGFVDGTQELHTFLVSKG